MKSNDKLANAMRNLAKLTDESEAKDPWRMRKLNLPAYKLDVVRDGSEEYLKALAEAILAITRGDYGCISYKGYEIYYTDTPQVESISLEDGHVNYWYRILFRCDALSVYKCEEYNSEDERKAFLDPSSDMFEKTVALLDKEIEFLDVSRGFL